MKIENLLVNNIFINSVGKVFKEGSIIKGKIIELFDNSILIDIKGYDKIIATLETGIKAAVGEELSFLIKSINDTEIILKPLISDEVFDNKNPYENDPISKFLQKHNIKESKLSIGLVENLMKYNAPITEKNLINGIKTLEKLEQLVQLNDNEKVILIETTKDNTITDGIPNREVSKSEVANSEILKIEMNYMVDKDHSSIKNIDIKKFLVVKKNDYPEFKDYKDIIKGFFNNNLKLENQNDNIKIISFLLKNNMKTSLNNINYIKEFDENPLEFVRDFKQIDTVFNSLIDENNISIERQELKKETKINELQKFIRDFSNKLDVNLKDDINNLDNKIQFLKDINKDLTFFLFPFNYCKKDFNGLLTLIKENNKKKDFNNKINIYLNINTFNLGNIKVSCQLVGNSLFIKMNVNKNDLELFKSTEKQLIEKITSIGYSLKKIEFIVDSNIGIMDILVSNSNPTYILDLKV